MFVRLVITLIYLLCAMHGATQSARIASALTCLFILHSFLSSREFRISYQEISIIIFRNLLLNFVNSQLTLNYYSTILYRDFEEDSLCVSLVPVWQSSLWTDRCCSCLTLRSMCFLTTCTIACALSTAYAVGYIATSTIKSIKSRAALWLDISGQSGILSVMYRREQSKPHSIILVDW